MIVDLDNRHYSKYTHLHILETHNNCRLDKLSAIAFNNKMNNRFSSKNSNENGGMEKRKNGGMEKKKKTATLTSRVYSGYRRGVIDIKLRLKSLLLRMRPSIIMKSVMT